MTRDEYRRQLQQKAIGSAHLIILYYIQKTGKCGFLEEMQDILLLSATKGKP